MNSIIRRLILRAALVVVLALSLVQGAAPAQAQEGYADTTAPQLIGIFVHPGDNGYGDLITLEYDEDLDESSVPSGYDVPFRVNGGEAQIPMMTALAGRTVYLHVDLPIFEEDSTVISYTPGSPAIDGSTGPIQDLAGNKAAPFTDLEAVYQSEDTGGTDGGSNPTHAAYMAEVNGEHASISFNPDLDVENSAPAPEDFTVSVDGAAGPSVRSVEVSQSGLKLSLASPVPAEDYDRDTGLNVRVAYAPQNGSILYYDGVAVTSFDLQAENITPYVDTAAPWVQVATARNLLYSGSAISYVTLHFDESVVCAGPGLEPNPSDFTVAVNGAPQALRSGNLADPAGTVNVTCDGYLGGGWDGGTELDVENTSIAIDPSMHAVRLALAKALAPGDIVTVSYTASDGRALSDRFGNLWSPQNPQEVHNEIGVERLSDIAYPGLTMDTDSEGDGATELDPVETSITVPAGMNEGSILITERPSKQSPTGYSFLGQEILIDTDDWNGGVLTATANDPFVLTISLDSSIVGEQNPDSILVFRNGTALPNCTDITGLSLDGDVACVVSRQAAGDDLQITIHTLQFSTWNVGVRERSVDTTGPESISFSGIEDGASFLYGDVLAENTLSCTAQDNGSGLDSCVISGYSAAVGTHTLTATATDNAGNQSTKKLSYNVLAWTLKGSYSPVDMATSNNAKAGSTVPLKFEVFKGGTELTDTSIVDTFTQKINCDASATGDNIEQYATGSTSLRYENGQFIFNWQTPKAAGSCYKVTVVTKDGSAISANFTLKK